MKFRVAIALTVLVCCGCSTASVKTEVASTKWRMENLEQRFLDFRDRAAMKEAKLSSRIATLEKELGLPVSTQEEMILSSTAITPDIHVFMEEDKVSAREKQQAEAKKAAQKAQAVAPEKKLEQLEEKFGAMRPKVSPEPIDKQYAVNAEAITEYEAAAMQMLVPETKTVAQAPVAPVAAASEPKVQVAEKPKKAVAAKKAKKPKPVPVKTKPKKKPAPKKKKTSSGNTLYKKGLALLDKGQYELGRETLEEFLTEFPKSTLVPNGVYWIGESFYSQKDFRIAIDLFREVVRRFPQSTKAQAALLKIGFSYERLNEISDARQYLLKVVENYPKSNEARLARKMLSSI